MVWPDWAYEPESSHPLGKPRPKDPVAFDQDLFDYHKAFTSIRRENKAIRRGDYRYVEVSQSPEVFAFIRSDNQQRILCVFNRSNSSGEIELPENFAEAEHLFGKENLIRASNNRFFCLQARL